MIRRGKIWAVPDCQWIHSVAPPLAVILPRLSCGYRSSTFRLPSDASYHGTYAATWVAIKLRWDLAVDDNERQALLGLAVDCPTTTVVYESAA